MQTESRYESELHNNASKNSAPASLQTYLKLLDINTGILQTVHYNPFTDIIIIVRQCIFYQV